MKIITINPDICVGCGNCEYACANEQKGNFDIKNSWIRVNFYPADRVCIPWNCAQCEDAWCMRVCPAGAISRDPETGAVLIDEGLCAGCKMCMLACPYGSIHFDLEAAVSRKCDLCGGDPQCVRACLSGALQFVEVERAYEFRRRQFDNVLRAMPGIAKQDGEER